MSNELTQKQQRVLDYLKNEIRKKGYPPAIREICDAVGLKSTSTVHAHLNTLERKGYIRRSPSKNRSIEILEHNFYSGDDRIINIPILGKVTAGMPILAIENIEESFPLSIDYVGNREVFMLKVSGDSMEGSGIFHKDLILVQKQPDANNGDIVVALLDDSATVKTFYREKDKVRLQPENPAYDPIITNEVKIIGKVIGLYRIIK